MAEALISPFLTFLPQMNPLTETNGSEVNGKIVPYIGGK